MAKAKQNLKKRIRQEQDEVKRARLKARGGKDVPAWWRP